MNLDFVAVIVGVGGIMFIPALNLFKAGNKVPPLIAKKSFKKLFVICIILAIVGASTIGFVGEHTNPKNPFLGLICPLYALLLYRLMLTGFRKIYQRDPIDYGRTPISHANKMDKLFHGLFFMLSILGPVVLASFLQLLTL